MLTIRNLRMSVGGRTLFENASLQVNYSERVALVGPNGAGKSTLFSLILGQNEPDTGTIERDEWTMVGYLPQESEPVGEETVLDVATGRAGELPALEKRLRELEAAGTVDGPAYLEASAKHDALANPQVESKAKKMLRGLGYKDSDFDRPVREMSGGWIMRGHLARLLVMEPDLLLLDEPTNHLDLLSLLWLQNYLKTYSGALLMISHDREFMDEVIENVYDIHEQKLTAYAGNYSAFLKQREMNYDQQNAAYKNQQKEIANLREFYDRFRSVASKASQAMSKLKQIERMELIEKPVPPKKPFRLQIPPAAARRAAGPHAERDRHGLQQPARLQEPQPGSGARRAHGAGGTERRGEVHVAQDSGGRGALPERRTQTRAQREDRVLQPAPFRDPEPGAHRH